MLIDTLEYAYINGFAYTTMRPVAPEEVPARFAARRGGLRGQALARAAPRLGRDDQAGVDRDPPRAPGGRSRRALRRGARRLPDALPRPPRGDDLPAHAPHGRGGRPDRRLPRPRRRAGPAFPPSELLDLMRGAAPVSAGASAELEQLIAAIGADAGAQELLESRRRSGRGARGAALARRRRRQRRCPAYLDLVGYRLLDGFDICGPCALELPDVLLRAIRVAVDRRSVEESDVEAAHRRRPQPGSGGASRAEFDELLGEARLTYRIRDERGVFSDIWASGLMRRAALGRRAPARRRGPDPRGRALRRRRLRRDVRAAVRRRRALGGRARGACRVPHDAHRQGGPGAPGRSAARRRRTRRGCRRARRGVMRAMGIALGELFGSSQAEHEEDMLRGLAASRGVYEGAGALRLRSDRVRPDRQGRRPRHGVDDRGVQHPAAAARGDRDRQRRPALALGDRRAGVRHPGRRRHARGDRADRRRDARARRRRCRRGDGARVSEVVALAEADDTSLFGSKAVGLGQALRDGLPRPARRRALGRDRRGGRRRGRGGDRRRSSRRCGRSAARWPCARRPSTRTAPTRASPAST